MTNKRLQIYCVLLLTSPMIVGCSTPVTADVPAAISAGTSRDEAVAVRARSPANQEFGKLRLAALDAASFSHLHNVWRLTDRIYSGSEPHGELGFAELAALDIDTIVSVDGARPNIDAARRHGLRYVHIPIGYDAVPSEAGRSLARVARETQAAGEIVYLHCHHGKHRGPAAAAVACIAAGAADNASALDILTKAGTSKDYPGLWRDVETYQPPAPHAKLPELVEVAPVDSLAAAMAQLDRGFDNLRLCEQAKWQTPADHPDIAPAQEALMVKEALYEAARNLADGYDEKFLQWLRESETTAANLERQLKSGDADAARRTFIALGKQCQQCHVEYRN